MRHIPQLEKRFNCQFPATEKSHLPVRSAWLVAVAFFGLPACTTVDPSTAELPTSNYIAHADVEPESVASPNGANTGAATFQGATVKPKERRLMAQGHQASEAAMGDFARSYNCGWRQVTVGRVGVRLRLIDGASVFNLDPEPASDATAFSVKGPTGNARVLFKNLLVADFDVNGEILSHCVLTHEWHMKAFRATGHEPDWLLESDVNLTSFTVVGKKYLGPSNDVQTLALDKPWRVGVEQDAPEVNVHHRLCRDTATGMPFPYTVEAVHDGRLHIGCGGETSSLLTGRTWIVTAFDGPNTLQAAVAERGLFAPLGHEVTIRFDSDGRVSGAAHCNLYTGTYALTAERLSVARLNATRRACLGRAMKDEQAFLVSLSKIVGIHANVDGGLILVTSDAAERGVLDGIHVR